VPRFTSLQHAPAQTRSLLRDRLTRLLPVSRPPHLTSKGKSELSDEATLALLLRVRIQHGREEQVARTAYDAIRARHSGAPPFDDLLEAGWVSVFWRRVYTVDIALRGSHTSPLEPALRELRATLHRDDLTLPEVEAREFDEAMRVLRPAKGDAHRIVCSSPEWVAARLWERALDQEPSPEARLRFWVDRLRLLPPMSLIASRVWDAATAEDFRRAALQVLSFDPSLHRWDSAREAMINSLAVASGQPSAAVANRIPEVPTTVVERALWLERRDFERLRGFDARADLWHLADLMLRDAEDADLSGAPHTVARSVFALALERPELLTFVVLRVGQDPKRLPDLLLHPPMSALGCLIVARWRLGGGAWERELVLEEASASRLTAFADAVAVAGHFLNQESLPPGEFAALLSWMHGASGKPGAFHHHAPFDERLFEVVRTELRHQRLEVLQRVAEALVPTMPAAGVGSPTYAAAVDVLAVGGLEQHLDPEPFLSAYLSSVRAGDYSLARSRIESHGARALLKLALRVSPERRKEFLFPLDIRKILAAGRARGDNEFVLTDQIKRSVRAHVRLLSRAIAAWDEVHNDEIIDALVASVRSGAAAHVEKGRVSAFSAHMEEQSASWSGERPIALDLAEALFALNGDAQEKLLEAVLEIDEPLMLAQLIDSAPSALRERIRRRIDRLGPEDAGDVQRLPEVHARIGQLLVVGAFDAAARYLDLEKDLETIGPVPGRALARLRFQMQLHLAREEFESIANAQLPNDLGREESEEWARTLEFYQALAQLEGPNGDLSIAERTFQCLHKRRPETFAYAVNLLAVRTELLLSGDLFRRLHGLEMSRARRALAEAEESVLRAIDVNIRDRAVHDCNRALLLLAMGMPEKALELLRGIRGDHMGERVAAYSAVALTRVGEGRRALETLAMAEHAFGRTETIRAARAHMERGSAFDARPNTITTEDPTQRLKAALQEFKGMDPSSQGAVLYGGADGFDKLVIGEVRSVGASVVGLVPMMKSVVLDSCEDDLTSLVRELLRARIRFLDWSLADQSKGGFSKLGNPGEPDILLMRDTCVLAVIEAVVCRLPVTQKKTVDNLTAHFQKLFGYSTCRLFFLVTYCYLEEASSILTVLKQVAQRDAPAGFQYQGTEDIPLTDSRPVGFSARFRATGGEVKVVFLVFDMAQKVQREAAKTAAGLVSS
jgi:hypothetical protein